MTVKEVVTLLNIETIDMKNTYITCYTNPDLDGFACIYAYQEYLGKIVLKAEPVVFGTPQVEAKYLLKKYQIKLPKNKFVKFKPKPEIILVDSSDLRGLDKRIKPDRVVEVIDHRKINEAYLFTKAKIQIELVGAAATLIAEKFIKNKIEISFGSAVLLYGAIISNTLNFKASVTTSRDKTAAAWLNKILKLPKNFWQELFLAKSDLSGSKLAKAIAGDCVWFEIANQKISIAQLEIIGAKELIYQRLPEIVIALEKLKRQNHLGMVFLNLIDLKTYHNTLVAIDEITKSLLSKALAVKFVGNVAKTDEVIMRKQIIPLLKNELEKK